MKASAGRRRWAAAEGALPELGSHSGPWTLLCDACLGSRLPAPPRLWPAQCHALRSSSAVLEAALAPPSGLSAPAPHGVSPGNRSRPCHTQVRESSVRKSSPAVSVTLRAVQKTSSGTRQVALRPQRVRAVRPLGHGLPDSTLCLAREAADSAGA